MRRVRQGVLASVGLSVLLGACLLPDAVWQPDTETQGSQAAAGATSSSSGSMGEGLPAIVLEPAPPSGGAAGAGGGAAQATSPADGVAGGAAVGAPDAGVPEPSESDAGGVASECARTRSTLVPDTNVCLFFDDQARVSWQAASLACQTRDSTLVSIKTLERDGFVSSLIDTEIWIGATDPGTDATSNAFAWRDQTPVDVNMETWAVSEPDGVAGQFCVSKSAPSMGGQWQDRPCSETKAYVCERTF